MTKDQLSVGQTTCQKRLRELANAFISESPPVLFLGAGVTKYLAQGNFTKPRGWTFSFQDLKDEIKEKHRKKRNNTSFIKQVGKGLPIDIPSFFQSLPGDQYLELINELFWKDSQTTNDALRHIANANNSRWSNLAQLFSLCHIIITTNYDPLCFMLAKRAWNIDAVHPINLGNSAEFTMEFVQPLLDNKDRQLVFWHGCIDKIKDDVLIGNHAYNSQESRSNIVLTAVDYAKAYFSSYGDPPNVLNKTIITRFELLRQLLETTSIVFIGYSLNDPLLRDYVMYIRQKNPDSISRHWLITSVPNKGYLYDNTPHPDLYSAFAHQFGIKVLFMEDYIDRRENTLNKKLEISYGLDKIIGDFLSLYRAEREKLREDILSTEASNVEF